MIIIQTKASTTKQEITREAMQIEREVWITIWMLICLGFYKDSSEKFIEARSSAQSRAHSRASLYTNAKKNTLVILK
jgi:hypothetical protein